MEAFMFKKVSHLQRAQLLSLCVKDLFPVKDGLINYNGRTFKKGHIRSMLSFVLWKLVLNWK